ncbi:periplasmic binding protein [Leptolyngbya sp. Heron Island J]|uniref:ABC transporter substrate-binding protein n=1 Tax=Leptolyngbya sp. Heron Island J TaxID=1385935 RepID=UPI0003B9B37B|nr:iron-siderophore ABC transporter substrate-binding protein [Leptolyngbya sp. Heron Island J]ESA35144.1 periplasmic binding protein [Leptolyngbya sp. Heron Island J]
MRKRAIHKTAVFFLSLVFVAIFAVTACDSNTQRTEQSESSAQTALERSEQDSIATKTVGHALGQVEIPLQPQRIVVLDAIGSFYIDALSSLGIQPVGVTRCADCIALNYFDEFLQDVPSVGNDSRPSLETILGLEPDLILGYSWQRNFYPRLSEIAPTVIMDIFSEGNDFKRNFRYLAEILGKSNQAEVVLANYDAQIQEFRQQMGDKLKNKTVSLFSFWGSAVHVYGPDILAYAQVLRDAGIQFIPAYEDLGSNHLRLSLESLPNWDADFLFLDLFYKEEFESIDSLSLFTEPLWSSLNAVQKDQVYVTNWYGGGPVMANQVIDDLYEYFSEML